MQKSVVVVGGGVIGLSCAYYAALRGLAVRVLDRGAPGESSCSTGNAGMIVPSHIVPLAAPGMISMGLKMMLNRQSPFYLKPKLDPSFWSWVWKFCRSANREHVERSAPILKQLHLGSRECFIGLHDQLGCRFSLSTNGLLMICKKPSTLDHETKEAERAIELGIPAERMNADELAKFESSMQMDVAGAIYFPLDCYLDPRLLLDALELECRRLGVEFERCCEITHVRSNGDQVLAVVSTSHEFSAEEYVFCGGMGMNRLSASLGLKMPLVSGKGYSMTVDQPKEIPTHCSILTEARVAVTPMGSRLRFGGTMELGAGDGISSHRIRGIVRSIPEYFPNWKTQDLEGITPWFGHRPCSPDGLPYLGRPNRLRNVVVATGHAMMGVSLAPITGKLCAELICRDKPSIPIDLLDPDRFDSKY
jgi:D-amino-acid dehydrogenase